MTPVPFPPECALDRVTLQLPRLQSHLTGVVTSNSTISDVPHISGQPTIQLHPNAAHGFLQKELETPILDEVYEHLWMVGRKCGRHIDELHLHQMKGREIVVIENPQLHLTWKANRVYLKPIPTCLLNHEFWLVFLTSQHRKFFPTTAFVGDDSITPLLAIDRSRAIGFLRSYAFLVQHQVDFSIAQKRCLIPKEIEWIQWAIFMSYFRNLNDSQVSKRYYYGQLRLTRLDWIVRLFRPRCAKTWWFYELPHWSVGSYVSGILSPLIFVFASLSVILSAMQILISFSSSSSQPQLENMDQIIKAFSEVVLLISGCIWLMILMIPSYVILWQLSWGFLQKRQQRQV